MDIHSITKYFGLHEHPFMTSPDPRFLYFSSQVKEALAKCEFMARDRIGPIYMYGPIGSGKTSLVRRLQEKLSQDKRYNVKLLISPNEPVASFINWPNALLYLKITAPTNDPRYPQIRPFDYACPGQKARYHAHSRTTVRI